MAVVTQVLARLRREPLAEDHLPIAGCLDQLCDDCGHGWRDRLLPPLVTLRLFLLQVLHGNCSITHLRQLAGLDFAPASYCRARQRLPLDVILGLLGTLARWAEDHVRCDPRLIGPRVLIVDGSSFSTADTPELRRHFGLWPGGKAGIAYPMGKLLGLLDAATGLFVQMLALPVLVHDLSRVVELHPSLRPGDALLGDRAFCSFAHLALLGQRGVLACCRLHQRRKGGGGGGGGVQRWHKDAKPPAWMERTQYATLPQWIDVRLVSYRVNRRGFRSRQVTVATTLLDAAAWPDERVAALYGRRWEIETCFGHLKTTLKMDALKCRGVEGVQKELAMYLLAYNLVRLAMLRSAGRQQVEARRVSFADAVRWLCARLLGLSGVAELIVNPDRRGRCQLRVIRGRPKAYDWLTRPREELKAKIESGDRS